MLTLQVAPGVFGTASASRDVNGVIGGFQSGYNYQFGQWVWGFETDLQASGQKGSEVLQITNTNPATFLSTDHKLNMVRHLAQPSGRAVDSQHSALRNVRCRLRPSPRGRHHQSRSSVCLLNFQRLEGWLDCWRGHRNAPWVTAGPRSLNTSTWTWAEPRAPSLRRAWVLWWPQAAASPTTLCVSVSTISGAVAVMAADMDIEC